MSRLIVKNLPNKVTQDQVMTHFSQAGQITDVKLKYNKNKEFRGFAFIGFKSKEDASQALKQFQNTFFKKNKITVEECQELDHKLKKLNSEKEVQNLKDHLTPMSDKKYFKNALKHSDEMTKEKLQTLMSNPSFIQYLKLNKKGTADLVNTLKKKYIKLEEEKEKLDLEKEEEEDEEEEIEGQEEPKEESVANRNISDLEYLQSLRSSSIKEVKKKEKAKKWEEMFTVVIRTKEQQTNKEKKGKTLTKKGVRDFFRPLKFHSLRIPRGMSYVAYVGFKTEKVMKQAIQLNMSFLDGVRVAVRKHEERNSFGEIKDDAPWKAAEEKLLKEADPIGDSGKLFVRNLCYSATEEELRELFEKIGPLADLNLPINQLTQKSKGFVHVTFVLPEHAVKALNDLDGTSFQGRLLHILPSLAKEENDTEEKSFKKKKEQDLKKNASNWHNWNSLFLGSGAVIDLFAEKIGRSKYEIFEEKNEESVAVNLALSEALIVENTKRFLEEEGVSLEAFSNPNIQRSRTIILVKNLPAKTAAAELKEMFEKFGQLGKIVLPPSGVTAIIEFVNASEAKRAFENLAYTRFKWLPLYLEWAPIQVFHAATLPEKNNNEENIKENSNTVEDKVLLYVKNLNFETDEDTLKQHFSKVGEISSVTIAKRRTLSQGYGFVEFMKASDADEALRRLQNATLDGHALTIEKSKSVKSSVKSTRQFHNPGNPTSAKLLVRNIPFQATWKEVKQLFQTFGEVKVRLPKKLGSAEHRGYGFVEFLTEEDAKKAMDALGGSAHFYGRSIVLEWANEEETVEELRRKTADRFIASGPAHKRQKIDVSGNSGQDHDHLR